MDKIYLTILNSDDLFANDMITQIQKREYKERRILVCDKGYVFFLTPPPILKRLKWFFTKRFKKYDNSVAKRSG